MDIFKTLLLNNPPNLALEGQVSYQGTWDASANSPALTSSVGIKGYYYVVSVAGSTNLDGVTDWKVGDWAIYNGTSWQKVDNTDAVNSVFGRTGAVAAVSTDYSSVGITNTAIGASSPSTGAFTTLSANTSTLASGTKLTIDTSIYQGIDIFRGDANANYSGIRFRNTTNTATNAQIGWNGTSLRLEGTPVEVAGNLTVSGTGTSSFAGPLNVKAATNLNWFSTTGTAGAAVSLRALNDAQNAFVVGEIEASVLRINANSSGNLLLGTTTDNAAGLLQIAGTFTVTTANGSGAKTSFIQGGATAGDYGILSFKNGSTVRGRIVADANDSNFRFDTGGSASGITFLTGAAYTTALTLDSSQNATFAAAVGIGGAPYYGNKLTVDGTTTSLGLGVAKTRGDHTTTITNPDGGSVSTNVAFRVSNSGGTALLQSTYAGNVTIPSGTLTVSGTGTSSFAGSLTLNGSSGFRFSSLYVNAANRNPTSGIANLIISTTDTQAAGKGGSLGLGGQVGGDETPFAYIAGLKENSISGNYAGYFSIFTQDGGAGITERMRIASSGNVGIGTTSPLGTLSINTPNLSYGTIYLNGATTGADFIRLKSSGADGVLGIESSGGNTILTGSSANATVLYTVGSTSLQFGTAGTVKGTLTSNGNLLLGTTTDAGQKLQVAGSVYFSGDLYSASAGSTWGADSGATGFLVYGAGGGANANKLVLRTASTTALTLDSSQNATFAGDVTVPNSKALKFSAVGNKLSYFAGSTYYDSDSGHVFRSNAGTTALTLDSSQNATFAGTITPKASTGSAVFALDTVGQTFSIANNGTATPFGNANNFSGMFIVNDTSVTGAVAVFITAANLLYIVSQTGSAFSLVGGTAGKTNVYLNSSVLTIENKQGSACNYNVMAFRTRQNQ